LGAIEITPLQLAYEASGDGTITVDAVRGALTIVDNAVPIGDVFRVRDNSPDNIFAINPASPAQINWGPSARRVWEYNDDPTSYGAQVYMPDGGTQTTSRVNPAAFTWASTLTTAIPGGGGIGNDTAPNFVSWQGELIVTDQGNLFNTQSLFVQGTTVTCEGANSGPIYTLINQPLLRTGPAGGARVVSQQNAVRSQLSVGPNLAGSITLGSHEAFLVTCFVNATVGTATITTVNYFAPKAPVLTAGGTIGTLSVMQIPNIPAAGITAIRGINSSMANGFFIFHVGVAPSFFNGEVRVGDGVPVRFGGDPGAGVELTRSSAGVLRMIGDGGANDEGMDIDFDGTVDVVEFSSSTGAGFKWSPSGAADAAATLAFGDGLTPDGTSNWWLAWSPAARSVQLAGDWFDVLFSPGANVDLVGNAMGRVATMQLVEPGITLSGGSVVSAATLIIANAPTEGTALNAALWVSSGLSRFDGRVDINNGIALGGGVAALLGTIGGAGPTVAAQAQWVEIDVGGVAHWIAVWI